MAWQAPPDGAAWPAPAGTASAGTAAGAVAAPGGQPAQPHMWNPSQGPPRPPPSAAGAVAGAGASQAAVASPYAQSNTAAAAAWQQQAWAAQQQEAERRAAWALYYQQQQLAAAGAQPPGATTATYHPGAAAMHQPNQTGAWAWGTGKDGGASTHTQPYAGGGGAAAPTPTAQSRAPVSFSVNLKRPRGNQRDRSADVLGADEPEAFVTAVPRGGGGGAMGYTRRPSGTLVGTTTDPAAAGASASGQQQAVWSPALKSYVNRAFATCSSDLARNQMEELLKEKITAVTVAGRKDTIDWDKEPLPTAAGSAGWLNPNANAGGGGGGSAYSGGYHAAAQQAPYRAGMAKGRGGALKSLPKGTKRKAKGLPGAVEDADDAAIARRQAKFKRSRFAGEGGSGSRAAITYNKLGPVTGLCQDLEKGYFRLNEAPDPHKIRPLSVLRLSLKHVKQRWIKEGDYKWFCDQMKGIRQDLQLQGIRNEFTVEVYETHARTALEKADSAEFNQCQVQLRRLYGDGVKGSVVEFTAYRILYNIYSGSNADQLALMSELLDGDLNVDVTSKSVAHAMDVRSAQALGNYARFFQLYLDAPLMGGYVMDLYVLRERKKAMLRIATAYRPSLPLSKVQKVLAFEDVVSCFEFLTDLGVKWVKSDLKERQRDPGGQLIDCKASLPILVKAASESRGVADWAK
eukprot:m.183380 g.183380  ORF g.183380 m.183380 type:complete len:686 (-) comp15800_c0_seq1:100-2157(-)